MPRNPFATGPTDADLEARKQAARLKLAQDAAAGGAQATDVSSLIGGVLGAVGGGLAGGPPGIVAGYQAGSSLGKGVANLAQGDMAGATQVASGLAGAKGLAEAGDLADADKLTQAAAAPPKEVGADELVDAYPAGHVQGGVTKPDKPKVYRTRY